eukprot:gnl/TRDRNA2_/TRDRNA2_44379_c0_seq1.p1 gnl/TRDRNA2_/TRDRNA2_44379_c0~~gnl/TRDRNA2_/TRDRNA2_44379_c0_seq1.p1  ORF type:complete len:1026 (+),score=174.29 gnl/TRDRNA2_/TRDRNA2_44379_c0_seq1:91-3168(+)
MGCTCSAAGAPEREAVRPGGLAPLGQAVRRRESTGTGEYASLEDGVESLVTYDRVPASDFVGRQLSGGSALSGSSWRREHISVAGGKEHLIQVLLPGHIEAVSVSGPDATLGGHKLFNVLHVIIEGKCETLTKDRFSATVSSSTSCGSFSVDVAKAASTRVKVLSSFENGNLKRTELGLVFLFPAAVFRLKRRYSSDQAAAAGASSVREVTVGIKVEAHLQVSEARLRPQIWPVVEALSLTLPVNGPVDPRVSKPMQGRPVDEVVARVEAWARSAIHRPELWQTLFIAVDGARCEETDLRSGGQSTPGCTPKASGVGSGGFVTRLPQETSRWKSFIGSDTESPPHSAKRSDICRAGLACSDNGRPKSVSADGISIEARCQKPAEKDQATVHLPTLLGDEDNGLLGFASGNGLHQVEKIEKEAWGGGGALGRLDHSIGSPGQVEEAQQQRSLSRFRLCDSTGSSCQVSSSHSHLSDSSLCQLEDAQHQASSVIWSSNQVEEVQRNGSSPHSALRSSVGSSYHIGEATQHDEGIHSPGMMLTSSGSPSASPERASKRVSLHAWPPPFCEHVHRGAARGECRLVQNAIQHGEVWIGQRDAQLRRTLLHIAAAASKRRKDMVELLLAQEGVEVDATDALGMSALDVAIHAMYPSVDLDLSDWDPSRRSNRLVEDGLTAARLLHSQGAVVCLPLQGRAALREAVDCGDAEVAKALLSWGVEPGFTFACVRPSISKVLQASSDSNISLFDVAVKRLFTAATLEKRAAHREIVEALFQADCKILDGTWVFEAGGLNVAIEELGAIVGPDSSIRRRNWQAVLEALREAGARRDAGHHKGPGALAAVRRGDVESVTAMLHWGVDTLDVAIKMLGAEERPEDRAAARKVAIALHEAGAQAQDIRSVLAGLTGASENGDVEGVSTILACGVDVDRILKAWQTEWWGCPKCPWFVDDIIRKFGEEEEDDRRSRLRSVVEVLMAARVPFSAGDICRTEQLVATGLTAARRRGDKQAVALFASWGVEGAAEILQEIEAS